jgi:hypothetical protein
LSGAEPGPWGVSTFRGPPSYLRVWMVASASPAAPVQSRDHHVGVPAVSVWWPTPRLRLQVERRRRSARVPPWALARVWSASRGRPSGLRVGSRYMGSACPAARHGQAGPQSPVSRHGHGLPSMWAASRRRLVRWWSHPRPRSVVVRRSGMASWRADDGRAAAVSCAVGVSVGSAGLAERGWPGPGWVGGCPALGVGGGVEREGWVPCGG